ncbi:hypothetical protein P8832_09555 [Bacillus subtilis]|uniref:hypothetical protein n=1 Tax=Bacillus subtilis TaxID=1423 RepID=UPI002DBE8E5C|nr:hypothetical protein [Bacillus subtilis]MEC0434405.1 hypothetical protein [Bacillus subtilis]
MTNFIDYSARVQIWTYGVLDGEHDTSYGRIFVVPESWLEKVLKKFDYEDISDFQTAYIWDESLEILSIAEREGVVIEECDLSLQQNSNYENYENFVLKHAK